MTEYNVLGMPRKKSRVEMLAQQAIEHFENNKNVSELVSPSTYSISSKDINGRKLSHDDVGIYVISRMGPVSWLYIGSSDYTIHKRIIAWKKAVLELRSEGDPNYQYATTYRNRFGKNMDYVKLSWFPVDMTSYTKKEIKDAERIVIIYYLSKYGRDIVANKSINTNVATSRKKVKEEFAVLPV
jgi:hypothetical protein